jgi:ubiquinone/menaquinone biosynthesis C-methylase UbiE
MSNSIAPASSGTPSSGVPPSCMPVALNMRLTGDKEQEVTLTGTLRPFVAEEMTSVRRSLEQAAWSARGMLCVNLKRLKYMNNVAFLELNRFVRWAASARPELRIKFVLSSVIPWAIRKFQVIAELYPTVTIEVYDKAFYPIQDVIEDDEFINVLRTQEKIIWEHEQEKLAWHGMRPGLRIADVCCGLGDFAILLQRDFRPEYLVGVDHSKPFLRYARQIVSDFGLENIEYQYGDAAALLLPDNSFDFVTCRLSLQVFNEPQTILRELLRICKPGGRIYITNELMAGIVAHPGEQVIRWTYDKVIEIGHSLGMDMDTGLKTREVLTEAGLEDVKIHLIDINNMNSDPTDFAKVVESWNYVTGQMCVRSSQPPEVFERIKEGLRAHVNAIKSDRGFASWPIYAGSGRKPFRA